MIVRYAGYALDATGYGEFARLVVTSLHEAAHDVAVVLAHDRTEDPTRFGESGAIVESLIGRMIPRDFVNVVNTLPTSFEKFRAGKKNVGFTMYESDEIPYQWAQSCNRMDGILVPTEFSRQAFIRSGVKVPVVIVHPGAPPINSSPPQAASPWTFFSAFEWAHPHKDPEALLEAYFLEFSADDPVLLRVKTFSRGKNGDEKIVKQAEELRRKFCQGRAPKLELVIGSVSSSEMDRYFESSSAYVSSHHGEGWGLPIWEAMRRGLPAIATAYGGNMEFMTRENSKLVQFNRQGQWAEVSVNGLREAMRELYSDQDSSRNLGLRAKTDMETRFSRAECARSFEAAVEEIYS